jgi:hypothetical protein
LVSTSITHRSISPRHSLESARPGPKAADLG